MTDLPLHEAVTLGGWDPRYARALATATRDAIAAAIVDSNGDERDVDLDVYERKGQFWDLVFSQCIGDEGSCYVAGAIFMFGRENPGVEVRFEYAGMREAVTTSAEGWYLWLGPDDPDAVPRRLT